MFFFIKILAIISSHRKKGHTSKIISILKEQLEELAEKHNKKYEFEIIFLGDYKINHCKGCRTCMDIGEELCPWNDDIPQIKSQIKEADCVIFASPVFVGDVSSSMKALIDRLAYVCHRQEFYEKCAVLIATTNATSLRRTIRTMGAATYSWGFKLIGKRGFRTKSSMDSKETLEERYSKYIKLLANKIFYRLEDRAYLKPSALSLTIFKIQKKYRSSPELSGKVDFIYWKNQGWTEPKTKYYIEHKSGILTKLSSRLMYKIISIFIRD